MAGKRKADWMTGDVRESVTKQMKVAFNEYHPRGPLTNRNLLMEETGKKPVGTNSQVTHYAHISPDHKGLDPQTTPDINRMFHMNIRGSVKKPRGALDVLVSDGAELSWDDDDINPSVDWAMNALQLGGSLQTTWRAVGHNQYLFSYVPDRTQMQDFSLQPQSPNDAKFSSVGILNTILREGGERDSTIRFSASKPDVALRQWRPFGAVKMVEPIADGYLAKFPLITFKLSDYCKVVNYWAACCPQVTTGSHCWWLYVRRPKALAYAAQYRDHIRIIREVKYCNHSDAESRKKIYNALGWIQQFDKKHSDDVNTHFAYQWEPWVEQTAEEPDPFFYSGVGWDGEKRRVGVALEGCAQLQTAAQYARIIEQVCYPDPDNLDVYDQAVATDSKTGPRYGLDAIGMALDWKTPF